jgi:membrane-bound metal-dependent hydrolase YbcI (DUF457 family)
MNILFHALIGLLLAKVLGINSINNILIGVLFSVFPDIDHILHLEKAIKSRRFGVESRSVLHEAIGLVVTLSCSIYIKMVWPHIFLLTLSCGLSHFIIDFLTRPSRPLYPFSNKVVDLKLYPRELKEMLLWDSIMTICLILIYIYVTSK